MSSTLLNNVLQQYINVFTASLAQVKILALGTLGIVLVIDAILAILAKLDDGDHLKTIIWRIIKYGAFMYIIEQWPFLIDSIVDSCIKAGNTAAGGGVSESLMKQPSFFINTGFVVIDPLDVAMIKLALHPIDNFFTIFLMAIATLGILLAFGIMAIQVFVTYLEFYILSALAVVFVPFGAWKHTSFMGEKAFGVIISFGVKLMVLTAIAASSMKILQNIASTLLGTDPTWQAGMFVFVMAAAMAFLAWSAPGMAAGLMNGSPTLTAGAAAGAALAAGAAAVGGAMAAGKAIKGGAGLAGAMAGGASGKEGALAKAVGALGGGASHIGKGVANMTGLSSLNSSFNSGYEGASGGGSGGSDSSISTDTGSSPNSSSASASDSGSTPASSSAAGGSSWSRDSQSGGMVYNPPGAASAGSGGESAEGYKPVGNTTPTTAKDSSSSNGGSGSKTGEKPQSAMNTIAQFVGHARMAIPPESGPSGGIHVPIKDS